MTQRIPPRRTGDDVGIRSATLRRISALLTAEAALGRQKSRRACVRAIAAQRSVVSLQTRLALLMSLIREDEAR